MNCKRLDFLLEGFANKEFKNGEIKNKFYLIGKTFFNTKFEEHKVNYDKSVAEDKAIFETRIYIEDLLKMFPEQEINKYLGFFSLRFN